MPYVTDREALERVRSKLLAYFDEATEGARVSSRAFSLFAYYVRQRDRLNRTRIVLHTARKPEEHERILHEAEMAYLRRQSAFSDAPSSSSLLREWTNLLVEATEKVDQDRQDAALFARVGSHPSDDDREWADAAARTAGKSWTSDS